MVKLNIRPYKVIKYMVDKIRNMIKSWNKY
jgi:hypothetical protein